MALMYLATLGGAFLMVIFAEAIAEGDATTSAQELVIIGVLLALVGVALTIPYVVAFALPRRPWAWIYHLVLIAIGMTSACCLPLTVPLLIFWLKPEVQSWYGRR